MYNKELFIKRLMELRAENNLSQEKLGKLINVSEACISRWEKGSRTPNAESIYALSKAFNCTSDYLLGLTDY